MLKNIFLFICFTINPFVYGQAEFKVNYDEIKIEISNPKSKYYYPKLLERYNNFDTNLTHKEYCYLYYGFPFQESYLVKQPSEKELNSLIYNRDFKEAIKLSESILALNPVSLKANDMMAYILFTQKKPEKQWKKYRLRYRGLINAITWSGDGLSCQTAFKVIYPSDKFHILYTNFGVETILKDIDFGNCHEFNIESVKKFSYSTMYFDQCKKYIEL